METIVVQVLAALAQESRLAVVRLLVVHGRGGLSAGRIGQVLGLAPATLSFHLKELAGAGLIRANPVGRFIVYRADFEVVNALIAYLTDNCCADAMAREPSCTSPVRGKTPRSPALAKPTIHPKSRLA